MLRMVVAVIIMAGTLGCAANSAPPATQPAAPPRQFIGTLQGGMMAIGGETTGWALMRADEKDLELDISAVREQADQLDGQRVAVSGRMTQRDYVERGRTPLLVVQRIRRAE